MEYVVAAESAIEDSVSVDSRRIPRYCTVEPNQQQDHVTTESTVGYGTNRVAADRCGTNVTKQCVVLRLGMQRRRELLPMRIVSSRPFRDVRIEWVERWNLGRQPEKPSDVWFYCVFYQVETSSTLQ